MWKSGNGATTRAPVGAKNKDCIWLHWHWRITYYRGQSKGVGGRAFLSPSRPHPVIWFANENRKTNTQTKTKYKSRENWKTNTQTKTKYKSRARGSEGWVLSLLGQPPAHNYLLITLCDEIIYKYKLQIQSKTKVKAFSLLGRPPAPGSVCAQLTQIYPDHLLKQKLRSTYFVS